MTCRALCAVAVKSMNSVERACRALRSLAACGGIPPGIDFSSRGRFGLLSESTVSVVGQLRTHRRRKWPDELAVRIVRGAILPVADAPPLERHLWETSDRWPAH